MSSKASRSKASPKKARKAKKARPVRSWGMKTADGELVGWADPDRRMARDQAFILRYRCVRVIVSEA